jgi:hypothetical protein
LTAALALCASACAPTLPALLAARRYDEAICLNDEGHYPRKDDATVMRAVEAAMRPTVQLHVVTQEELDQVFAAADSEVRARAHEESKRVFVVQTHLEIQTTPVHRASAMVTLQGEQSYLPTIGGSTELAAFFHEKLPQSHQEGPGVAGALEAWGKDAAEHPVANFLTLGLWSALSGPSAKPTTVSPTEADYQRMAPISHGLRGAFPWRPCGQKPGAPCESWDIYERPKDEGTARIKVRFGVHAEAEEEGGLFSRYRKCEASDAVEVDLPTGGTIEERFAAGFGERARSFSELGSPSAHGRRL